MEADEHAVLCDLKILLDVIGLLVDRHLICGQRVFRRVRGGTAMRDQGFVPILSRCGRCREENEKTKESCFHTQSLSRRYEEVVNSSRIVKDDVGNDLFTAT